MHHSHKVMHHFGHLPYMYIMYTDIAEKYTIYIYTHYNVVSVIGQKGKVKVLSMVVK